jgi:hypothetical protein
MYTYFHICFLQILGLTLLKYHFMQLLTGVLVLLHARLVPVFMLHHIATTTTLTALFCQVA